MEDDDEINDNERMPVKIQDFDESFNKKSKENILKNNNNNNKNFDVKNDNDNDNNGNNFKNIEPKVSENLFEHANYDSPKEFVNTPFS